MAVAFTAYSRPLQDARRVAETFRAATKAIDGKRLRERLEALAASELPEDLGGRHTAGYIAAIMEVAADAPGEDRSDARKFATEFVSKDPAYSRTRAGLAAVMFEAWIIENGGTLYGQFVETVLDGGDSKFLAIFEGRLTDQDKDRLRSGTSAFVKIEPIAEAGMVNYTQGDLLEFSMFDCTAVGKVDKNVQPKDAMAYDQLGSVDTPRFAHESILPRTHDEYADVFSSGGVGKAVATFLFGADRLRNALYESGEFVFVDDNGIHWHSESGQRWMPACPRTSDVVEDEPEVPAANGGPESNGRQLYETNPKTGALRSHLQTWAVFRSDVLAEGITVERTVVVVGGSAFVVPKPLSAVRTGLDRCATIFDGSSPRDRDGALCDALQALVNRGSKLCENSSEVVRTVLPEADSEEEDKPDDDAEKDSAEEPSGDEPAGDAPTKTPPKGAKAPVPGETPAPPEPTDRMDEPEFYRDDVQAYYDMQIVQGKDKDEAIAAVKKKFKLSQLVVTPTGEVRSPDVVDDPKPPRPGQPVPPAPPAPPVAGDDEEEHKSQIGAENSAPKESVDEVDLSGVMPREVKRKPIRDTVSDLRARRERRIERHEAIERAGRAHRFHRLANMRSRDLREHLRSEPLRTALSSTRRSKTEGIRLGRDAAPWVLRLKETEIAEWTPEMWEWCDRVVSFVERVRRNGAPVVNEHGDPTRKLLTLRTWGHDPLRESVIEESEVDEMRALSPGLALRIIDATATDGPVQFVESESRRGPDFKTLKKNKTELTVDERAECMSRKAVWRMNGNGPTPAVWKSEVGGKAWYVTNTHRAYNVTSTLEGTIERFHKFIKSTA